MHLIKLTTSEAKSTYGDVSWIPGTTVSIPESDRGTVLAQPGLFHIYHGDTASEALALGLMMDPIHTQVGQHARAFEVRGELVASRSDLGGAHELEVGSELEVVIPTLEQRVRLAIYCAQAVIGYRCPEWSLWAARWLSGKDRSNAAAWAAARAAWAVEAAAWEAAAAWAAARAARAQADASWEAACATAACATAAAARTAARTAAVDGINLGALALRAIQDEL